MVPPLAVIGNKAADDHFNMKLAADGRLWYMGSHNGRLGVVASRVGPPPVKGKGQKRRQNNVGDDRPPVRAVKPLDQ